MRGNQRYAQWLEIKGSSCCFCHTATKMLRTHLSLELRANSFLACDQFQAAKHRAVLLNSLPFPAYRFEFSWSRTHTIQPTGKDNGVCLPVSFSPAELLRKPYSYTSWTVHFSFTPRCKSILGAELSRCVHLFRDTKRVREHSQQSKPKCWRQTFGSDA